MWKLNRFDLDRVGGTAERKITAPAKTLASPTPFKEAPHSSYGVLKSWYCEYVLPSPEGKDRARRGRIGVHKYETPVRGA